MSDYVAEGYVYSANATLNGTLILVETDLDYIDPFVRPVPKNNWRLKLFKDGMMEVLELKNLQLFPDYVDLFPDGTLLLVQNRCLKDGYKVERNARIFNRNGQKVDALVLGDGIAAIRVDYDDMIWCTYFDEGIFGNFGWDEPIGSPGFIAFTKSGETKWQANKLDIIDGYAIHIDESNDVFFLYYDTSYRYNLLHYRQKQLIDRYKLKQENHDFDQFLMEKDQIIGKTRSGVYRYKLKSRTLDAKGKLSFYDKEGKKITGDVVIGGQKLFVYGKKGIYQYTSG
ncbi:hypothetical protein BALCAV_0218220 [Alkalihalobacillus alcalophilus ATCC 27647 = CGMCC 1.3604]|uniref:Uncharacterized protein n=1 Tax=Alkalihalobacillus alcalophilus ATCC 27647 = CGMCC 1.3604 TaxID=1218173 RepID=A0A094WH52_ALKAL|nr:hypothetical protein BALCAV_0218220 [Alkalihalobacillus alcalophilus ATCC 27647 = CGMCC 1.3604]